jgi:D-alanyl-D-alanine carboxypeptidase (penicillin-binding protein 5/6)
VTWPVQGSAAIGAVGYGVFATHGNQTPIATASLAKVITALAILKKHPLQLGEQGPTITLTDADTALYRQYVQEDGSNTLVAAGEKITEFQGLESMLLPSSNNMADTMAIWAFGSLSNYRTYATDMVKSLGMDDTTIGVDASGFSPTTTSTASDLVILGENALQNPVIAQIGNEQTADVPVAGTIHNVNYLLGKYGINGLKTGSNDQDPGSYIFSAPYTPAGGQPITVVGVIMGSPSLAQVMSATPAFLNSTEKNLGMQQVATAGQVFGTYSLPWSNSSVNAITKNNVSVLSWRGSNTGITANLEKIRGDQAAGDQVGTLSFTVGQHSSSVPLVLEEAASAPSMKWRFAHIPSQLIPESIKTRLP